MCKLAWLFSAETISILTVDLTVLALTLTAKENVMSVFHAAAAAALFPLALLLVWALEKILCLD